MLRVKLIIWFLLFMKVVSGQVLMMKDTFSYEPKYDTFYNLTIEKIEIIKNSEKVDKNLMKKLNAENENKENFKLRIQSTKQSIKNIKDIRRENCSYELVRYTENDSLLYSTLAVRFQTNEGVLSFNFKVETKEFVSFSSWRNISPLDRKKMLDDVLNKMEE